MKNWKNIITETDVDAIIEKSTERTQIIFKDSVTCGISAFAKERLQLGNHFLENKADFHYLDLLQFRAVSNYIASTLNVIHQSPQIIVLKNKVVVYKAAHHTIMPETISQHL